MRSVMCICVWEGQFPTHRLDRSRGFTLSKALLKFIFPVQSVFFKTQLKSPYDHCGAMTSKYEFHIVNIFSLLYIGWAERRIYIHYADASANRSRPKDVTHNAFHNPEQYALALPLFVLTGLSSYGARLVAPGLSTLFLMPYSGYLYYTPTLKLHRLSVGAKVLGSVPF